MISEDWSELRKIEDNFEQIINDFTAGNFVDGELNKVLSSFDSQLAAMPRDIRDDYLRKLSSQIKGIDDSENPKFSEFIINFSLWVYNWKTKTVKRLR